MPVPLFECLNEIVPRLRTGPRVLLALDFDGTLTPHMDSPDQAELAPDMHRLLTALATQNRVVLVFASGRALADVQARVGLTGVVYVGNHGHEISGAGLEFVEATAVAALPETQELANRLLAKVAAVPGAFVEDKGLTISVHYRLVAPEAWEELRRTVHAVLAGMDHPFQLTTGEMVWDLRPRTAWNKGVAVTWIREQLGLQEALPIFLGDDSTDEDVFAALPDGITVKVRRVPETAARYEVEGPIEVQRFLWWLLDELRGAADARPR